ncbi:MAG TPA: hypothetical protein VME46_20845 [Acidimicrobiales bacterium]|nr:hypothetical protein [Acidimicrobiales bacterium]
MPARYEHLGIYSDWVGACPGPKARSGGLSAADARTLVDELVVQPGRLLGPQLEDEGPADVRLERSFETDGLVGEELSYSVGYGPRARAWLLKPEGAGRPLPGVLALHSHDGFKYLGKEKIADGPQGAPGSAAELRSTQYSGRPFANDLARAGFVVLVPDVFSWGSRRFPLEEMPDRIRRLADLEAGPPQPDRDPEIYEAVRYNAAAWHHEHLVEKYCSLLGTTLAAVVAHEDRIALRYLLNRADTTEAAGCIGLSGGGCRSVLLRAASDEVRAAVVVGMMGTYDSLLDHNVVSHTWMLAPARLPANADWPHVAACRAPAPLLVQYNRHDPLFPLEGCAAAHDRIAGHYAAAGAVSAYRGDFYDGPHKFDRAMQQEAFTWLTDRLR